MATYNDLTYEIVNNKITITDCSRSVIEVEIPNRIDGYLVTSIGNSAFSYCSNLTSITIPDSVTSIGEQAFYECKSLTSVYINDIEAWCKINFNGGSGNPLCSGVVDLYLNNNIIENLVISNSVTSIGEHAFYNYDRLISVIILDGVTSIGNSAFSNCSNLTSITIPDSVTSIGDYAFSSCSNLTSITIPNSVTSIGDYAFSSCSNLTSVIILDGVTSIGNSAFNYCRSLTSITIPDSVTSIGNSAFYYCESLTSITIPDSVTSIGDRVFCDCESLTSITIPNSVTSIGDYAFFSCSNLTSVIILDGVTSIGDSAFWNCDSLTSITIPDSVTSIGNSAFSSCSNLTSVIIFDGVTSIGNGAFSNCRSLTSITIPDSVTSIGNSAFSYCSNLTSITIPDSVTSIGNYAFYGCESLTSVFYKGTEAEWDNIIKQDISLSSKATIYYMKIIDEKIAYIVYDNYAVLIEADKNISGEVFIPHTVNNVPVTEIANNAFENCESLTSITIPDSVTTIGDSAFMNCTSLESIIIPNSVTSIGVRAFDSCGSLKNLNVNENNKYYSSLDGNLFNKDKTTLIQYPIGKDNTSYIIPNSVTSIGDRAFSDCSKLTSITIPNSVTSIGDYAFSSCSNLTQVFYLGTEEQAANKIESLGIGNDKLIEAEWIYGYETIDGWRYVPENEEEARIIAYGGIISENSITIPNTIEEYKVVAIDKYALPVDITELILSNHMRELEYENFSNLTNLKTVTLGTGLQNLGELAFANTEITSINLPEQISELSHKSFLGMNDLTTINVDENNQYFYSENGVLFNKEKNKLIRCPIKFNFMENSYVIPDSVVTVDVQAFFNCINLTDVELPDTLQSIEEGAFSNCSNLSSVNIPDEIKTINIDVFKNCPKLKVIDLHNIENIKTGALSLLEGVEVSNEDYWEYINLNPNVTIAENSFFGRGNTINQVYFGGSLENFNNYVKDETIKNIVKKDGEKYMYKCCNAAKTEEWEVRNNALTECFKKEIEGGILYIPEEILSVSVTKIGENCFKDNEIIGEVQLHENVTNIETNAFCNSSLSKIELGNKLINIGDMAFMTCNSLTEIKLPNKLKSIGDKAFAHCTELSNVIIDDNIDFIGSMVFYDSQYHGYSTNWKDGLFIIQGNEVDYLIDINRTCMSDNVINLENLKLKLIASGTMDINQTEHAFLENAKVIKLPFHLERINENAINLNKL